MTRTLWMVLLLGACAKDEPSGTDTDLDTDDLIDTDDLVDTDVPSLPWTAMFSSTRKLGENRRTRCQASPSTLK